ncbi:bifunctional DNA primase/polymerase [Meiothermus sp.]|uniref:bifunctional DNA primase/polymerase n=1 Tax=Meiothermus sp. TaxID=1955249 RepID=UPI002619C079|nr:bifunctional DNA primase/polymerase [Meiothermus sp.]
MLRYVKYSTLEYALEYARLGYAVLPLQPGEKRPHGRLAPNGLKDASTEPRGSAPLVAGRAWGWGGHPAPGRGAGAGLRRPRDLGRAAG